ncbi:heparinase II/III family protein [Photobacterium minamisatsumaniensis]|uniref:heparinase II/III family protein n=1 Tax=Photobacterium minamisatsumaniensis TaxID=2910233 RepID=UPI003D118250
MSIRIKAETALALGVANLGRVFAYRFGVKAGLNPVKRLQKASVKGPFFHSIDSKELNLEETYPFISSRPFGWMTDVDITSINWFRSCLTDHQISVCDKPWYDIPDFDAKVGDIKGVWEASRFDWVIQCTQLYLSGDDGALLKLNQTLDDWIVHNPTYLGPNWKCGQEASIRVMHLAMAAKMLNQVNSPELALLAFVKAHLERIAPTISYAVAQDNNHGTSEAAALFIGGSWLHAQNDPIGKKWMKLGRKWLENRAKRLIDKDGSFSQYSTNYHRVMLDTYSIVEIWRSDLGLPLFTNELYIRLKAATNWLYQFTQEVNGDVPNLGANDGARLLQLTNTDYRDFRPSVQLASVIFHKAVAWSHDGEYDLQLKWLGLVKPEQQLSDQKSFHFSEGGYFGLRASENTAFAMMTYPKFRFRPSQCDALHLDFWFEGENLLRDGGTFSYNAGNDYINYYGGVESHNTVQFDGYDQMPRLSRFLLGSWLKAKQVTHDFNARSIQAGYADAQGANHLRKVSLDESKLTVSDEISEFKNKAVLRWRLKPSDWVIKGQTITDGQHVIIIQSDMAIHRMELTQGKESRYYYHESDIPVLEIEVHEAGCLITEYKYQ